MDTFRINGDLNCRYVDKGINKPSLPRNIMTLYILRVPYIMYGLSALRGRSNGMLPLPGPGSLIGNAGMESIVFLFERIIEISEESDISFVDPGESGNPVILLLKLLHIEFRAESDRDSWFSNSHFSCSVF